MDTRFIFRPSNVRVSRVIGLILLLILFEGCSISTASLTHDDSPANSGVSLEEIADESYKSGDFDQARDSYLALASANSGATARVLEQLGNIALLNNQADEAESYFQQAIDASKGFVWPKSAGLNTRMGMVDLRRDDYAKARKHFGSAAGVLPIGPFKSLKALSKQAGQIARATAYEIEGPASSSIPFITSDPLPVLNVRLNQAQTAKFIIDTGGMDILLDKDFARKLGIELSGEIKGAYAGGKSAKSGLGQLQSLAVGDYLVRNIPVVTVNMSKPLSSIFGMDDIRGVIGTRFLMHFLSTIDYRNSHLILRRPDNPGQSRRIANAARFSAPMWLADTHYILTRGSFNQGKAGLFWLDTGLAGRGFSASKKRLADAGVTINLDNTRQTSGAGGAITVIDVNVNTVELASNPVPLEQKNVQGVLFEEDNPILNGALGLDIIAVLSHDFFRQYALTLDFQKMQLFVH